MAMDCAASSIHHSPLSQMLPLLGKDTKSNPVAQPHTGTVAKWLGRSSSEKLWQCT